MNLTTNSKKHLRQLRVIRLIPLFLTLMMLNTNLQAQENSNINPRTANISVIARADSDSVVLRWAPSTSGGWVVANQIGYIVERVKLDPDKIIQNSDYIRLTGEPLKPLSLDVWKTITKPDNIFSAVAAQALYGKSFNPTPLGEGNMNALKNAADELTNRYSFSLFAADNDAITAEALGLRFVDREIEKDEKYAYRVFIAQTTDQYSFDTAYIVVDTKPFMKEKAQLNLRYESGDGSIKLFWKEKTYLKYSGYYVYRSEDGGNSYRQLNKMPIVTIAPEQADIEALPGFTDTTAINYKTYKYQIKGVNPFGELSEAVEITASAKDLQAPSAPFINKPVQVAGNKIKLTWRMEDAPDDLLGFVVSRSNNSVNGFRLITQNPLPKASTEYIDDMGGEYEAYYNVAAVDTAGNMTFSLPVFAAIIDTIPPTAPIGLEGKINERGIVELKWKAGLEKNIAGYRILRANDPTHEFVQVTGQIHPDTLFIDSINIKTLTKRVYYRIAAVNNRYQHSGLSAILKIERPDIIPPGEAVFADVFVTDTSVQLKWHPSPSIDLAKQILLRKVQETENWESIATLSPDISSYTDKEINTATIYEYTIVGVDSSNLSSKQAFPVMARPYDSGKRKPVENFTAQYNQTNKTINLKWEYTPVQKEKTWYVIYKTFGEGGLKEYKALESTVFQYTDNMVSQGTSQYGIVVMTSHGGESEMIVTTIEIEAME